MADLPRAVLGDDRQVPVNQRPVRAAVARFAAPTTTRRDVLQALSLFGIGVAAAACTPTAPPASAPTAVPSGPTATPLPRTGGVLRMGIIGDFASLEGQTVTPIAQDNLWGVWDRLIAQDVTTQPKPMLAERWDISPDYSEITFNLRRGVKFHTGRELTSEDVKFSLQRLQEPKVGSSMLGRSRTMIGWATPDTHTIVVKASRPWPDAFDLLQYVNIIDPETFATAGLSKPVGTGPFMFAEYQQGDHLTARHGRVQRRPPAMPPLKSARPPW